ncbi:NB-ARC domain-containing protein [Aerosakkonema funiforme]|uniref:NB-ARC domain-containing protein n=1 Tax=Aerosakkonema funiforme TaxID=1246630 RepID=UPI0035BAECC3
MPSLKASALGLIKIKQARKERGWNVDDPQWLVEASEIIAPDKNWQDDNYKLYSIFAPGVSLPTWKRFLKGQPINGITFKAFCQVLNLNWEDVVERPPVDEVVSQANSSIAFSAYNDNWVGRQELLSQLINKLNSSCRILILTGITGIGKSATAEKLVFELLSKNCHQFISENFDNQKQAPDFISVGAKWLDKFGITIASEEHKEPQEILNKLVDYLQNNEFIVQMDSLEEILEGNEEEGWNNFRDEWWSKFFHAVLSSESFRSQLILTSQDLPTSIFTHGSRYQNFWHYQPLSGLTEKEQLELFDKMGLDIKADTSVKGYLKRIGSAYEGHPLALRVITGEIVSHPFNGNVLAYWSQYGDEIVEVEKAIEEGKAGRVSANDPLKLHNYTQKLKWSVRSRLEKTLNRLEKDGYYAYILLCAASEYRCAVKESWWLNLLQHWDDLPESWNEYKSQQLLDILRDRNLIEEVVENNEYLIRQHNLIRSIALEHLKKL